MSAAIDASVPETTKVSTDFWLGVFRSFCDQQGITIDLKKCSPSEFDAALSQFYVGLRKKNGEMYRKSSYLAARAALSQYVEKTLERPECNVFRKAEFQRSNPEGNRRFVPSKLHRRKKMPVSHWVSNLGSYHTTTAI